MNNSTAHASGHYPDETTTKLDAVESLRRAAVSASSDPTRPVFHFLPPANWMNDPNGPIHHNGYFHVFYQHNPFAESWGNIHWGHARSRDLVHWEHLPIALSPSADLDESHCYSGSCTVRRDGTPVILYTKVSSRGAREPFEQWMAVGDEDLLTWRKYEHNPILSIDRHDGPAVLGNWRDPFVFHENGRTYMILGAVLSETPDEEAAVLLYRACNDELTEWTFQSVLFSSPKYERGFLECPNFFHMGDEWVLFVSPYHPVEYYVGDLDPKSLTFRPRYKDRVDHSIDFYASNTFQADDGRRIALGWIRGFEKGRAWNGCLSLPREIERAHDGALVQRPIRELSVLRGQGYTLEPRWIRSRVERVPGLRSATLELRTVLRSASTGRFGLRVRMGTSDHSGVEIALEHDALNVAGMKVPLPQGHDPHRLDLHLFLDRSVLELFSFDGRVAVTKTMYPPEDCLEVGLFAYGQAKIEEFDAWELKPASIEGFPGRTQHLQR